MFFLTIWLMCTWYVSAMEQSINVVVPTSQNFQPAIQTIEQLAIVIPVSDSEQEINRIILSPAEWTSILRYWNNVDNFAQEKRRVAEAITAKKYSQADTKEIKKKKGRGRPRKYS